MPNQLFVYLIAGFVAEMICGTLGMGYGVTATTVLLATGMAPAFASATVHASEIVTMGMSALSHWKVGNVDWRVVKRLIVPGILGAVAGVFVVTSLPAETMRICVAIYLFVMGVLIAARALGRGRPATKLHPAPVGVAGGFFDSIGGGGFGTIVTGTLIAHGYEPRTTIGSVNFSRFFVSLAATIAFLVTLKIASWTPIIGLSIGGGIAAPIAAVFTKRVPARPLTIAVGALVVALSLRTIYVGAVK